VPLPDPELAVEDEVPLPEDPDPVLVSVAVFTRG